MKLRRIQRVPKSAREIKELRRQRLLLILSGLLLAAGFPPIPLPVTLFFGLVPFFSVIEKRDRLVDLNRASFLMSFTFSIFALYWVGAFTEWKDPFLMAGGVSLFFINTLAFMVPTTILYYTRLLTGKKAALFLFPFFWVFYEYIYTLTDWSFPWLNLGNGIANFTLFIQIADIIGAWGLSLVLVSINLLLFLAIKHRAFRVPSFLYLGGAILIAAVVLIYGVTKTIFPQKASSVSVAVIQPNLDPYDKWAGNNVDQILDEYLADTRIALIRKPDFIIWPETALPVYFMGGPYTELRNRLFGFIDSAGTPLLSGMPDIRYYEKDDSTKPYDVKYNKRSGFYYATYNAAYLIAPNSRDIQKYGKSKLVPFGERVPFVDQIPVLADIMRWGVGIGGWNVGLDTNVITVSVDGRAAGLKLCTAICYESIYSEVITEQVRRGAQAIIVITNDSWYGNTSGPYQHRDFAKLRAVEARRPVIRAANGGISCIISEHGILGDQTKMYERTVYHTAFIPAGGLTFYVQHPNLIPWICTLLSVPFAVISVLIRLYKRLTYKKPIVTNSPGFIPEEKEEA